MHVGPRLDIRGINVIDVINVIYICDMSVQHDPRQSWGAVSQKVTTGLRIRLRVSRGVLWVLDVLWGYRVMEINIWRYI